MKYLIINLGKIAAAIKARFINKFKLSQWSLTHFHHLS